MGFINTFFFLSFVETPLQQGDPPGDNSFSLREILWSASSLAPDTVRPDLTLRLWPSRCSWLSAKLCRPNRSDWCRQPYGARLNLLPFSRVLRDGSMRDRAICLTSLRNPKRSNGLNPPPSTYIYSHLFPLTFPLYIHIKIYSSIRPFM